MNRGPTREPGSRSICIALLVAVDALHGSGLAVGIFRLVAIDAQPGRRRGIVEGRLQLGCDRWSRGVGVAISAGLLRRLQWLLRLGSVMANAALAGHFQVRGVIELHRAKRRALEDDRGFRRGLSECASAQHDHDQPCKANAHQLADFQGALSSAGESGSSVAAVPATV